MALLIKKTVTTEGLSRIGCYIQLLPNALTGIPNVPIDRNIWKNKTDFLANQTKGTITKLDEIKNSFLVARDTAPSDCQGSTVEIKALYWLNTEVKAQILADNITWTDDDIDIIDLN
jgi:hypothetical protein